MEFRTISIKLIASFLLPGLLLLGFLFWKFYSSKDVPTIEGNETQNSVQDGTSKVSVLKETVPDLSLRSQMLNEAVAGPYNAEDVAIQQQLDRDRQQQKHTKDLKIKLEQTNLELEQEKDLAELNKLKKENMEAFNEPAIDGQSNLPEVKIDYIGGDSANKEAIVSIGGTSYQVKEKSNPTDNIQVISISDSSVTLHFNAPQNITKSIDYKPE